MAQQVKEVKCKHSPSHYNWDRQIARETENNNVILKLAPCGVEALQSKEATLTNATLILMDYFALRGIEWKDEYVHFANDAYKAEAKADTSNIEIDPVKLEKVRESLATIGEPKVRLLLAAALFSPEHIEAYISKAKPQENPFL